MWKAFQSAMTMGPVFRKQPGPSVVYFLLVILPYLSSAQETLEVISEPPQGKIGENATLVCRAVPRNVAVVWLFHDKPLEASDRVIYANSTEIKKQENSEERQYFVSKLTIVNTTDEDAGNYSCKFKVAEGQKRTETMSLDLGFPAKFVGPFNKTLEFNALDHDNTTLKCVFEVYKPTVVQWWKRGSEDAIKTKNATRISLKEIESTLELQKIGNDDNGTYVCQVWDTVNNTNVSGSIDVVVYDKPHVMLDQVIGISTTELYLNWTVKAFNSKILSYVISYSVPSKGFQMYTDEKILNNSTSFVVKGLNKSTHYTLKLEVRTKHGQSIDQKSGKTLDMDPVFVPNISINGFSATSVTIGWAPPPKEIEHLIHYYLLEARKKDGGMPRKAYHSRDARNLPYMFDNLEPHCTYIFKVRACQDFTKQCGNWSEEMEAATLDGTPGKPDNVTVSCTVTQLFLSWQPPHKPNAEIKGYKIELTGIALYKDGGTLKEETYGPLSRFMTSDAKNARFDDLKPNTNFTVRVSAMTRSRRKGEEEIRHCTTATAPPDYPPRPRWRKIVEDNKFLFKVYMPKVSERNGPICCYRVYMVRMPLNKELKDMKKQQQLEIIDYEEAHSVSPILGAYITDVFTNANYPPDSEIMMGDDKSMFNKSDPILASGECSRCLRRPFRPREVTPPPRPSTTSQPSTTPDDDIVDFTTDPIEEVEGKRERRSYNSAGDYGNNPVMSDAVEPKEDDREMIKPRDGPLDSASNYTLFVELIPGENTEEPLYSEYVNLLMPAATPAAQTSMSSLEIALQASCAVAAVVLVAMIIFCVMQTRSHRKAPHHAPLELNPIQVALRYIVGSMGRSQAPAPPPDMPPIAREDLAAAYAERHADSDYGFQREFELLQVLSECFPDRTTHASEARENQPKNRYPDIKAYDQTRVKLNQIDGITGSDYINANYVMGYKERKKFICAQGPTDTTVNDFWRMMWEHGLELIVMLTNLEEYSKVKCSKYWPDSGSRAFGNVTVTHVSEKRYSDYIVRELRITKQPTNADGQPIVENNGVAKRNGDINTAESAPTSPRDREVKDAAESRVVRQYHFLMWKDFAAPEYPQSILKFIKRVNEAWSAVINRPVVVHCSAGVGRTGTLVALDCLLQQLDCTGHAAVFNTIAELRRQRNFLVQSQKQYVFVYRALVEYAYYGDTEIPAARLKAALDRLRNTPEGADKCLMEHEFEKLLDSPVSEVVKSQVAGAADEVRNRNRSTECLPYDRNRVMLAPLPNRDFSTYINASFIEAYDNSEGFIITQDPLPNTIFDFWRMVSEQNVSTIVMLSELGEGKCPRYWDDGSVQYEHMTVQYDESESCPYYTRRQFRVTNNKSGECQNVTQLQYQGWPTAAGAVPEVTRGLAELADAAAAAQPAPPTAAPAPMLVHCNTGTERSALFVALCILIQQLRTERRVDVSAIARKMRAQRAGTINTFTQYEFLHRAILNYAELHNLLEDS